MNRKTASTTKTSNLTRAQELFSGKSISLTVDAMLTQVLRNDLIKLTELRDTFNAHPLAQRTPALDVRDIGHTAGGELLRGIEQAVSYTRLLALISEIEHGIALRIGNGQS
jgi:hypothetical protein